MKVRNVVLWIGMFAAVALAAWDGSSMKKPGVSPYNNGFEIYSAEELAWFANAVNSGDTAISAILQNDIDLSLKSWTPIGQDDSVAFDGVFEGNGYSISGINVSDKKYAGLFGVLDVGTVKNLTIKKSEIKGAYKTEGSDFDSYSYVGGVAGYAGPNSLIQNVKNEASHLEPSNVTGTKKEHHLYMGGLVGRSLGSIIDCSNVGSLYQSDTSKYLTSFVGGIVGYADGNLQKLLNVGTIEGGDYTGGIFGDCYHSNAKHLTNAGNIKGRFRVGGICGLGVHISNAINTGLIEGKGTKDSIYVGGICGSAFFVDSSNNSGFIEVVGNYARVGGISGYSHIMQSLNYGGITVSTDSSSIVGGIVGAARNDPYGSDFSYCGNFGEITATSKNGKAYVGGIAGQSSIV